MSSYLLLVGLRVGIGGVYMTRPPSEGIMRFGLEVSRGHVKLGL